MNVDLLPCPFCGGAAQLIHDDSSDYERNWTYTVECANDDCSGGVGHYPTANQATTLWNQRHPIVSTDLEIAFHNWLVDYETGITERWERLAPQEWHTLTKAQWEMFRDEFAKTPKNGAP